MITTQSLKRAAWGGWGAMIALALAGCGNHYVPYSGAEVEPAPTIVIIEPDPGDSFPINAVMTVRVGVSAFSLDPDQIGAANQDGVGHWRLLIDDAEAMATGENADDLDLSTLALAPGIAELTAELVQNDGTSLDPPAVSDVVSINLLEATTPTPSATPGTPGPSPTDGESPTATEASPTPGTPTVGEATP